MPKRLFLNKKNLTAIFLVRILFLRHCQHSLKRHTFAIQMFLRFVLSDLSVTCAIVTWLAKTVRFKYLRQLPGDSHYRGDKSDVEVTQTNFAGRVREESLWRRGVDRLRQTAEQNKKVSLEISLVPQTRNSSLI
jgi:hypothetical protein